MALLHYFNADVVRRYATALIALCGVGIVTAYAFCNTSCTYLQGEILGIDLKYVGIVFMAGVFVFACLDLSTLLRAALAGALGGEFFLLWFQYQEGVFCPYCLAYAACIAAAYAVNYQRPTGDSPKRVFYLAGEVTIPNGLKPVSFPLAIFMLAGFAMMVLLFSGGAVPAYG